MSKRVEGISTRKPHNGIAGYVCELKCKRACGGHVVVYDRERGADWIDADERWVVMHEPSTLHVAVSSLRHAREIMKDAATDTGRPAFADIIPGDV